MKSPVAAGRPVPVAENSKPGVEPTGQCGQPLVTEPDPDAVSLRSACAAVGQNTSDVTSSTNVAAASTYQHEPSQGR